MAIAIFTPSQMARYAVNSNQAFGVDSEIVKCKLNV
jgi:hypothetical protein